MYPSGFPKVWAASCTHRKHYVTGNLKERRDYTHTLENSMQNAFGSATLTLVLSSSAGMLAA